MCDKLSSDHDNFFYSVWVVFSTLKRVKVVLIVLVLREKFKWSNHDIIKCNRSPWLYQKSLSLIMLHLHIQIPIPIQSMRISSNSMNSVFCFIETLKLQWLNSREHLKTSFPVCHGKLWISDSNRYDWWFQYIPDIKAQSRNIWKKRHTKSGYLFGTLMLLCWAMLVAK